MLFQLKSDLDIGSNLLNGPLKESELAEVFDRVRTLLQIEVSDYQLYPGRVEPAAFIASPVFNVHGRIIGFVTLELGNQHVFRIFKDYSGLGSTGETMVVMRSGDELTFVAPPRNDSTGAFKYRIKIGSDRSVAMQRGRPGPTRLWRDDRLSRVTCRRRVVVSSFLSLGNGGQAGYR